MSTTVELSRGDAGIATLTFTSPKGVNVISTPFLDHLEAQLAAIEQDPGVRVVIVTGAGKTFLAGADIAEMAAAPPDAGRAFAERGKRAFDRLAALPAVTIAAINGAALGGGCEAALACDLRIMSSTAKIGMPEVKLGLIPGWGGTQRSLSLLGAARAKRLVFTGDAIDAALAREIGLVNESVEPDQLLPTARKLATQIVTGNGPNAVRAAKCAMAAAEAAWLRTGQAAETEAFARVFAGAEGREGCTAFLEKRKAQWA
ncbi:MAG: enoyl-CoA hydratase-related protein [Phycisphaerae bacterium]